MWNSSSHLSIDNIFNAIPGDCFKVSRKDNDMLVKLVSIQEVYHTLKAMPKVKSPGPDGLYSEFYLYYWNVGGTHLFKDVRYFFDTAQLPNS